MIVQKIVEDLHVPKKSQQVSLQMVYTLEV